MSRARLQRQQSFCAVEINRAEARPPTDSNQSRKSRIRKLDSAVANEELQAAEISQKQNSLQDAANEVKSLDREISIMKDPGGLEQLNEIIETRKRSQKGAYEKMKKLEAEIADNKKSMETPPAKIAQLEETLEGLKKIENQRKTYISTLKKVRHNYKSIQNWDQAIAIKEQSRQVAVGRKEKLEAEYQSMQNEVLAKFGPSYTKYQSPDWTTGKKKAWDHVLRRAKNSEESKTIYLQAMRKIEEEARQTYEEGAVDDLNGDEFLWMMIIDGCFLLQLALFYLGASQQLGYPDDDPIFGERSNKEKVKKGIKSMFLVGNQIPLIVLEELMKQDFFQEVAKSKQNWELPSDLPGQVLYQFLLLPARAGRNLTLCAALSMAFQINFSSRKPSDLLHGLHLLVVGQGRDYGPEHRREDGDLDSTNYRYEVSSVTELKKAGINVFVEREGIRGITFKDYLFEAVLFLPKLVVDEDTEQLFQNLKDYEITQRLGSSKREVSSYLQFMSELVRTPEDAELLIPGGIIKASPSQREKLPAILSSLASKDTSHSLRLIRLKVSNYSRRTWVKFRDFVAVVVLILTLIQTVYAVVSYHAKKN